MEVTVHLRNVGQTIARKTFDLKLQPQVGQYITVAGYDFEVVRVRTDLSNDEYHVYASTYIQDLDEFTSLVQSSWVLLNNDGV